MKVAAIYSRVSSDKQREEGTIVSQTEALVKFAKNEGLKVPEEWIFQDDGYSGANLIRPGLERVRDLAAEGQIQVVLIYSPDRLSRKYAYQVLLIEELARHGVEAKFIKSPQSETPEGQLLLQFQGMIAEYERAQIQERTRRGKIHKAKQGHISVLSGAPYGYRYIKKRDGLPAYYEVIESEAEVVQKVFELYTITGLGMSAICRQLEQLGYLSPKKKTYWGQSTISRILHNPAYKGTACFGKTISTSDDKKPTRYNRLHGISCNKTKRLVPSEKWTEISVPPLVSESTFAIAQELLIKNKILSARKTVDPSVLQGLVSCQKCSYALVLLSRHLPKRRHRYYCCTGSQAWRHPNGKAVCDQKKSIRQDVLDDIVWSEVVKLIEDPTLIQAELDRRLKGAQNSSPTKRRQETLTLELTRVQKSMERLLRAYQEDLLSLDELRARLPELRQQEKIMKAELQSVNTQVANDLAYLKLAETLSSFQNRLHVNAENLDISERQKIVRLLVREVVVGEDKITIRHSIPEHQSSGGYKSGPSNSNNLSEKKSTNEKHLLCSVRQDSLHGGAGAPSMAGLSPAR
jgi:site-specific DNA recombinase